MSFIQIKIDRVNNTSPQISQLCNRLATIKNSVMNTSHAIDWEIKSRRNIDSRLSQVRSDLMKIESHLKNYKTL